MLKDYKMIVIFELISSWVLPLFCTLLLHNNLGDDWFEQMKFTAAHHSIELLETHELKKNVFKLGII